jgi:hypothetical protein
LREEVIAIPAYNKRAASGSVAVGSYAYDTLIQALDRGEYAEEIEGHLIDEDRIRNPHPSEPTVAVTYAMANDLLGE